MNNYKIKTIYKEISMWEEYLQEIKNSGPLEENQLRITRVKRRIGDAKREIRELQRETEWGEGVSWYPKENGESYRLFYTDSFSSPEQAKEWEIEVYKNGNPCQYYDFSPTGLWFVSDVRVAHIRGNQYRIMIQKTIDV